MTPSAPTIPSRTDEPHYYYQNQEAKEERRSGINLKLLLPIIGVVAIVGGVVAFNYLGSTNQSEVTQPPVIPKNESSTSSPSQLLPPPGTTTNAIPVASNQSVTTNIDSPINIALAASDEDSSDDLTADIVSIPSNGKLSEINQSTGSVIYTPDPGFVGDDQFTFKVNDGKADSSNIGTVEIVVASQQEQPEPTSSSSNHPPIPTNQSVTTNINTPIEITLSANDQDANDDLTATIISKPLNGSLGTVNQNTGAVTYTPHPDFTGTDQFTFNVNDGTENSNNIGTVKIEVK